MTIKTVQCLIVAVTGIFLATSPVGAQYSRSRIVVVASAQARIATAFLSALDRSDISRASQYLHPAVRQRINPATLVGTAVQRAKVNTRRLTYESSLSARFGKSDQMQQRMATVPGYVVCFIETPRSGYGQISYVSVTLLSVPTPDGWLVSDYRVQPERSVDCPK